MLAHKIRVPLSAPLCTLLYPPATNHPSQHASAHMSRMIPQHASTSMSRMIPCTAQYTMLLPSGRDTVHCLYGVMNSLTSMGNYSPPPMILLLCRFCSKLVSCFERCDNNVEQLCYYWLAIGGKGVVAGGYSDYL